MNRTDKLPVCQLCSGKGRVKVRVVDTGEELTGTCGICDGSGRAKRISFDGRLEPMSAEEADDE